MSKLHDIIINGLRSPYQYRYSAELLSTTAAAIWCSKCERVTFRCISASDMLLSIAETLPRCIRL
jgi:hypothetical protein